MIRITIGGIMAGVVFFFWGFLVYMVIGLHAETIRSVPDEIAVAAFLNEQLPETGVYHFPSWSVVEPDATQAERDAAMEDFIERHEAGPIALLFFRKEGMPAMHPMHFFGGLAIYVLVGLIASILVGVTTSSLGFIGRWLFVVGIGAIAVLFSDVSMWNWWHLPSDYSAMMVIDHLIGWALAGVAISLIVRPVAGPEVHSD